MDKREAHFIGGPRDGQSMFLRTDGDYHYVALMPAMSTALWNPDAPVDKCATFEKFTYKRLRIHRQTWVFIPLRWFDEQGPDLEEYVMNYLVRGYIGNRQR